MKMKNMLKWYRNEKIGRSGTRRTGKEKVYSEGEVFGVREECVTLERKNTDKLNERNSRNEMEKCVRRQKNGEVAGPDGIPYEMYENGGEVVFDRMTEVWEEEKVPRM